MLVVDVCCGSGNVALAIAHEISAARVYGADLSGEAVELARRIASHEPRMAFDGGPLGVTILMRLLQDAPRWLRPGGWLAFEVGAGQGGPVVRRLRGMKSFCEVRELTNEAGEVRAVLARRAEADET